MTAFPEEMPTNLDSFPADTARQIALSHGIDLTEDRLTNLIDTYNTTHLVYAISGRHRIVDPQNDLIVWNREVASRGWWSCDNGSAAEVDFVPDPVDLGEYQYPIYRGERQVVYYARPDKVSQYGHQLIQGFQNYFLLVEAGLIEPRDQFIATATSHIAKAAKNLLGFTGFYSGIDDAGQSLENISASVDFVRDRIFSERMRSLDDALVARLKIHS